MSSPGPPPLLQRTRWGKKAESASELEAGTSVLFEGKLRKRPKGEGQWEMVVSGFDLTPIQMPVAAATGD